MALLKEGRLLFYETACDVLVVGNQDGQISTLTAKCIGYEETYDFTWDFYSDGHEGFVLANPDQTYATVLSVCR
nr:hypothetical protein [uncultured Ruegeria sp.]